ncbi:threonine synthase [Spirochaetota bacterium]|nr:threonine synthase [Spirochaetota bacterium]
MPYISTRGKTQQTSLFETLLTGLAPDGGLYLPAKLPYFSPKHLTAFSRQSYEEIAYAVLNPFFTDLVGTTTSATPITQTLPLRNILKKSYQSFRAPNRLPIEKLKITSSHEIFLAELFHGPTYAFKDFALQFLAPITEFVLNQANKTCIVLGATSGDTGSAAITAFKDIANGTIVILHPHSRISPIQRRQMTTTGSAKVINLAVKGTFDDCQRLVKNCLNDTTLNKKLRHNLIAVNSINWVRILAQSVYYFYIYSRITGRPDSTPNTSSTGNTLSHLKNASTPKDVHHLPKVNFVVPTGNFGDVFAGYLALKMGVPINKLIVATNANNVLHRFFQKNTYTPAAITQTHSPSMDIATASNFERYLYYVLDEDAAQVRAAFKRLAETRTLSLTPAYFTKAKEHFTSTTTSNDQTLKTIVDIYHKNHYLLDPHTAVGVHSAHQYLTQPTEEKPSPATPTASHAKSHCPTIVLATAHPAKFRTIIETAATQQSTAYLNKADTTKTGTAKINADALDLASKSSPSTLAALTNDPKLKALASLNDLKEEFKIIDKNEDTLKRILLNI